MSEIKIEQLLTKIQTELRVPKNRLNKFANYKYRNLEDIFEALKLVLDKSGCSLHFEDDIITVGDRIYYKAEAVLTNRFEDGQIRVAGYAREPESKKGMDDPQLTVTVSSYARKYALAGMFLLDDVKDADTEEYALETNNSEVIMNGSSPDPFFN